MDKNVVLLRDEQVTQHLDSQGCDSRLLIGGLKTALINNLCRFKDGQKPVKEGSMNW